MRLATQNKIGRFTRQDIRELCPSLSVSSVEGALRKMVSSGELKRESNGKNTCYHRTKQHLQTTRTEKVRNEKGETLWKPPPVFMPAFPVRLSRL